MENKNTIVEYTDYDTNETYTITIGQNAQNNWNIIKQASQNDIWLHIANLPSCHVIIQTKNKKKIPKKIINYAAGECKANSKFKNVKNLKCIYTNVKNVKINKNSKVGSIFLGKRAETLKI
jgi:predicted ribosome quality control (RQC) complex YloA/Tae2 family protein